MYIKIYREGGHNKMKKACIIILIALLFLYPSFIFAKEVQTRNIGLVLVENIGEDENGLVVLDGIFTTITFRKFPGVDDLFVYSRWVGSGKHYLKAQIIDNSDNVIIDSGDVEFDFNDPNSVYYEEFKLNNIVFTKPGLYWVQVLLDDEVESSIPLFIESKDKKLEVSGLPEKPVLITSVTAISVRKKESGLPVISGVFENFSSTRFPFADDFIVANIWYSGNGDFNQYIEFVDPDGNIIYKSELGTFTHEPESLTVMYDELEDIIFYKPGEYRINVYLEEELVLSYPVLVLKK